MLSFKSTAILVCLMLVMLCGCEAPQQPAKEPAPVQIDPRSTIGSVSQIFSTGAIRVRGIGLVAGLPGTGSSECPPRIRADLEKYIWQQIPRSDVPISPAVLIESRNTAVVEVFGIINPLSTAGEAFDITVRPLSSTQTTSLDRGHLYTTELKEVSRLSNIDQFTQFSTILALADGPIYSNKMSRNKPENWYVLNGGRTIEGTGVKVILNQPDFRVGNAIRNRINERFGRKTAVPDSSESITLNFPPRYLKRKQEFLQIVQFLLIADSLDLRKEYRQTLFEQLVSQPNKEVTSLALEGLGKPALDDLSTLLAHPDLTVQFHAARCMLRIGDDRPVQALKKIIANTKSPFRIPAIIAIGRHAKRSAARPILLNTLNENDLQVRLTTYEMLVELQSPEISRKYIANNALIVDSILCTGPKVIYVYQQKTPRIVIFGSPIKCDKSIFLQSDDKSVTLNASADDKYIAVSRRHPSRPRVIGPISSGRQLRSLIQTLGELPDGKGKIGLAVPYADILPLLEKMCLRDVVNAAFIAEPESEITSEFQVF